jgi:hypothetical protein
MNASAMSSLRFVAIRTKYLVARRESVLEKPEIESAANCPSSEQLNVLPPSRSIDVIKLQEVVLILSTARAPVGDVGSCWEKNQR